MSDTTAPTVGSAASCSAFYGPRVCQHCGYYAQVSRRTVNHGWHIAEWGECRKADLANTGVITPENETCADFTPDPRRWPNRDASDMTAHIVAMEEADKALEMPNVKILPTCEGIGSTKTNDHE